MCGDRNRIRIFHCQTSAVPESGLAPSLPTPAPSVDEEFGWCVCVWNVRKQHGAEGAARRPRRRRLLAAGLEGRPHRLGRRQGRPARPVGSVLPAHRIRRRGAFFSLPSADNENPMAIAVQVEYLVGILSVTAHLVLATVRDVPSLDELQVLITCA